MNKPSETKPCPECERFIPVSAVRCRCGWTAPQGKTDYVACAMVGCPTSATIRAKTKTGWANVCDVHDKLIVQKRADAYCLERGLDTVQKQRDWVLKHLKIPQLRRAMEKPVIAEPTVTVMDEESIPF